jgi:hypothetical protein
MRLTETHKIYNLLIDKRFTTYIAKITTTLIFRQTLSITTLSITIKQDTQYIDIQYNNKTRNPVNRHLV